MKKVLVVIFIAFFFLALHKEINAQTNEQAELAPSYGKDLFLPNRLIFKFRNWSNVNITDSFVIRFQWLRTSDKTPVDQGYDYTFTEDIGSNAFYRFDSNNISDRSLLNYILNQSEDLVVLQVDLNSTRNISERTYGDNRFNIIKINRDLDMVLESFNFDQNLRQATFTVRNNHSRILNYVSYKLVWISADNRVLKSSSDTLSFTPRELKEVNTANEDSYDTTDEIRNMLKNPVSGATKLQLIIDPNDDLIESNEDNNTKEVAITPLFGDLEIVSPQYSLLPDNLNYRLTFKIRNKGSAALVMPFPVKFSWFSTLLPGPKEKNYDIPDNNRDGLFSAGEEFNFDSEYNIGSPVYNFLRTPNTADHKLLIEVDPNNTTNEFNNNNSKYKTLRSLPDFYFENINLDQNNRLTFTIKNKGLGSGYNPTNTFVNVIIRWNTALNDRSLNFSTYSPGSSESFDSERQTEIREYLRLIPTNPGQIPKLSVKIDKNNLFAESDENNNERELTGAYVDLAILNPLLTPVGLTFRVKNEGTLTVSQSRVTITQLGGTQTNNNSVSFSIGSLRSGESYMFNSSNNQQVQDLVNNIVAQEGSLKIELSFIRTESNNITAESNEPTYNNSYTVSIVVPTFPPPISSNKTDVLETIINSWNFIYNRIFGVKKDYLKDEIKSRIDNLTPTPLIKNAPEIEPSLNITSPPNRNIIITAIPTPTEKPVQKLIIIPTLVPSLIPTKTPTPTLRPIIPINTIAPSKYQIKIIKTPTPKPTKKFNLAFP